MEVYNFYLNTGNQDRDDRNFSFNYRLGNNIHVDNDHDIYFKLINFSMMNSMLNVSSFHNNNKIKFSYGLTTHEITIPDGNYTVTSLRDKINELTSPPYITPDLPFALNYDSYQNKYYWTNSDNGIFYPMNMKHILGFNNDMISLSTNINKYGDKFANMLPYTKIILTTNSLLFEPTTENNLLREYSATEGINEIICWIDKDIPTFATIKFENFMNNEIKVANRNITYINFNIVNEYKEAIKDCPNCFIQFQLIVKKKS